jgi:hypothetical protein
MSLINVICCGLDSLSILGFVIGNIYLHHYIQNGCGTPSASYHGASSSVVIATRSHHSPPSEFVNVWSFISTSPHDLKDYPES